MLFEILNALSTLVLGIFLGAQITEGVLLVPYWKSLAPKGFFELHRTYGKKIHRFFAPLTIAATIVPLLTVTYGCLINIQGKLSLILMGFSTIVFFSTYFLYFKKANEQFAEASVPYNLLPRELNRWENWHWGRIFFELMAFVCSIKVLAEI